MLGLKNPCGKVCPLRTAECKKTCKDWRAYEIEYFERFKEQEKAKEQESDYYNFHRKQMSKGIGYKRVKK